MSEFHMADLGQFYYFMRIEFQQTNFGMLVHQAKYAIEILKKFEMGNCYSAATPVETDIHLVKEGNEGNVDSTQFRMVIGQDA